MNNTGSFISKHGLDEIGLSGNHVTYWNLTTPALYSAAIENDEARIAHGGPLIALTGEHTGRSPNDKCIVCDSITENEVSWGNVNKPITSEKFELIYNEMITYLNGRELYVQDCYAGADPVHQLPIRVVSEYAWHNLFARNLFITPSLEELNNHTPEFTIIQAPGFAADPKRHGTNSSTCILVDFSKRISKISFENLQ